MNNNIPTEEDFELINNCLATIDIKPQKADTDFTSNVFKNFLKQATGGLNSFLKFLSKKENLEIFIAIMTALIPFITVLWNKSPKFKNGLTLIFGKYLPAITVFFTIYDLIQQKTKFGEEKLPKLPKELKTFFTGKSEK